MPPPKKGTQLQASIVLREDHLKNNPSSTLTVASSEPIVLTANYLEGDPFEPDENNIELDKISDADIENEKQLIKQQFNPLAVTDELIQELSDKYLPVTVTSINDVEQYETLKSGLSILISKRTAVEARRKKLKEKNNRENKLIEEVAKYLKAKLLPIEEHCRTNRDFYDAEKDRIKNEKKLAEEKSITSRIARYVAHGFRLEEDFLLRGDQERVMVLYLKTLTDAEFEESMIEYDQEAQKKILADQQAERLKGEQEQKLKEDQEKLDKERKDFEDQKRELQASIFSARTAVLSGFGFAEKKIEYHSLIPATVDPKYFALWEKELEPSNVLSVKAWLIPDYTSEQWDRILLTIKGSIGQAEQKEKDRQNNKRIFSERTGQLISFGFVSLPVSPTFTVPPNTPFEYRSQWSLKKGNYTTIFLSWELITIAQDEWDKGILQIKTIIEKFELEEKQKKEKEGKFNTRINLLTDIGLVKKDVDTWGYLSNIVVSKENIEAMSDEYFDNFLSHSTEKIKELVKQAEEDRKKREKQIAETARVNLLKKQQTDLAAATLKRETELAEMNDKQRVQDYLSQLSAVAAPELKAAKFKKILSGITDFLTTTTKAITDAK